MDTNPIQITLGIEHVKKVRITVQNLTISTQ